MYFVWWNETRPALIARTIFPSLDCRHQVNCAGVGESKDIPRTRHNPISLAPPPRSVSTSSPTIAIAPSPFVTSAPKLSMTVVKNALVGFPRTSAEVPVAVSRAATNGPGPRERVSFPAEPLSCLTEPTRMYLARWVAISGFGGLARRMRKAVLRCSYVNIEGASPTTTESYSESTVRV